MPFTRLMSVYNYQNVPKGGTVVPVVAKTSEKAELELLELERSVH